MLKIVSEYDQEIPQSHITMSHIDMTSVMFNFSTPKSSTYIPATNENK